MNPELIEWAEKVRKGKKDLDQKMFDDIMKQVQARAARGEDARAWLEKQYKEFAGSRFVGGRLMETNSKLIRDKMWSIERKKKD